MARVLLTNGTTHKQVGKALLALAAVQDQLRRSIRRENDLDSEKLAAAFQMLSSLVSKKYFDLKKMKEQLQLRDKENIEFTFHSDGEKINGNYVVNIAVPDIGDKWVDIGAVLSDLEGDTDSQLAFLIENPETPDPKYNFSGFAEESLGNIVIFGCGR